MTYIFDYGATIDTPGNHWGKVIWHAYEQVGVPVSESEYRDAYVYAERFLGSHEVIKLTDTFHTTLSVKLRLQLEYLFGGRTQGLPLQEEGQHNATTVGADLVSARITEYHNKLLSLLYTQTQTHIAESRKVLEALKFQGHTLGLVSNFYGNIEAVLKEFGLDHLFTTVVESATEGIRKPDPRLLQLCMTRIDAKPAETVVIGDHLTKDIQPAQTLGCQTVWIKGEPWSDLHDSVCGVTPDKTITSLQELLSI